MKIVGTRYIKAKEWFGNVQNDKAPKFDATELEKVMRTWGAK